MIFGKNLTDPGADSNGSGKSGLLEGITLAMTGKTCRDVDRTQFVRDGQDECFVEFKLTNKLSSINELIIKRWIHVKKTSKVEIWENGDLNKQMTSVNEVNARILELIGLSREDLLHFFIIGQDTNHSFLSSGDSEQKEIISRLTNADYINSKIDALKLKKKESDAVVEALEESVQRYENYMELTEERIQDEKLKNGEDIKDKISLIEKEIESKNSEIKEFQSKIKKNGFQISLKQKSIESLEEKRIDLTSVEKKIDSFKSKIRELKKSQNEGHDLISKMERISSGKTICPKCNHEWHEGEDIELDEIPELTKETLKLIKSISKDIDEYNKKISINEKKLNANDEIEESISKINDEIEELSIDNKSLNRKIKSNEEIIIENNKKIAKLKIELKSNTRLKELKIQLEGYGNSRDAETDKLNIAKAKVDDYNYWIHHLSNKGFLTYLSNQSIKTIEGVTNSYLKKFNTDLQVSIEGFTVLRNGDIREKINISIIRNGRNIGVYNRYSGGEKGRMNLACIVGLQKLMNMSANNGGLNFLGLDEVFEGLDTTGQKDVLNILESLGVTSLVVSHRNYPIGAENEIYIEKIDGVSKIVNYEKENKSKAKGIRQ